MKTPELLAPVGSFPMLVTAVNAGANAVYFGLQKYGMRANAKNFTIKDLPEMRKICKKIKMYLTLNTIVYSGELKDIEKTIEKSKKHIDAIICWDLAIIQLCKKHKVPFHISTQASISNTESAKFYKKLGAERIVLARELNLKQIKEISKIIPVEAFAHGAMCVSVSGRCFTSQFLFNKSANRGECIHPCRRTYTVKDDQEGYELKLEKNKVMSAKDLCMLPFIEEMKQAGIISFKIEGRNRDPRYVEAVIRIYRKALDKKMPKHSAIRGTLSSAAKEELRKDMEELKTVYNRKFSSGFYLGKPTPKDFSDIENSASQEKKHFIGKIKHYYSKAEVGTIKLVAPVKVGDDLCIIGNETGIKFSKIESIEIKNKPKTKAIKAQEIGIKLPLVRKNDEVYKIIKKKEK